MKIFKALYIAPLILAFCHSGLAQGTQVVAGHPIYNLNGNIGIGTDSPGYKLDVNGGLRIRDQFRIDNGLSSFVTGAFGVAIYRSVDSGTAYPFQDNGNLVLQSRSSASRDIAFVTGATPATRMVIDHRGFVGIGTSQPVHALEVSKVGADVSFRVRDGATGGHIRLRSTGNGGAYIYMGDENSSIRRTDGTFKFWGNGRDLEFSASNGSTTDLYIKNGGGVGIGTTTPNQKLHVIGDGLIESGSGAELNLLNTGSNKMWQVVSGTNGGFEIGNVTDGLTDSSAPFFVSTAGNVGIGTITPGANLQVMGSTSIDGSPVGTANFTVRANDTNNGLVVKGASTNTLRVLDGSDNSLFIVKNTGNVGIGVGAPTEKLEVDGAIKVGTLVFESGEITKRVSSWTYPEHTIMKSAWKSGVGDYLFLGSAGNNEATINAGLLISDLEGLAFGRAVTGGTGLSSRVFVVNHSGNMGLGTETPTEKLEVIGNALVDGEIYSKRVKVSTNPGNWPDYVFDASYNLMPLSQVEAFIKANKHLPEIPSAKEVEENGQDLGDIQATLLKKMEEMTLYMIEMKKENEKLKQENKSLESRLEAIEKALKKQSGNQ